VTDDGLPEYLSVERTFVVLLLPGVSVGTAAASPSTSPWSAPARPPSTRSTAEMGVTTPRRTGRGTWGAGCGRGRGRSGP